MKSFRDLIRIDRILLGRILIGREKPRAWLGAGVLLVAVVAAGASAGPPGSSASLVRSGWSLTDWISNTESGSAVESALYRAMQLPGGTILFRRPPRESVPALAPLVGTNAALYSLRALEEEQALDFVAAEHDWKANVARADDKIGANLDLAAFYERRLRPQEQLAALEAAGSSAAGEQERWTAAASQRSWQAWERALAVVQQYGLPRPAAAREYAGWQRRYAGEKIPYQREFTFLVEGRDFAASDDLIARYRVVFPDDQVIPVQWQAELAAKRGTAADGLAVYDRAFQPLWPAALAADYYRLLMQSGELRRFTDALRAKLLANPNDLNDAARLFYLAQQQGQLEAAKAVLADYRKRKDDHGAAWNTDELWTLARLAEGIQDFPEAARYSYALASDSEPEDAQRKGLAGLTRVLLTAPEQPLRVGAANLALYQNIATMDRGPGYLNGILSLFLNSASPRSELAQENQLAIPYFHRAKAAELLETIDKRFPSAPERAELHAALLSAFAVYGDNDAIVHEGNGYLAQFPEGSQRVEVALQVADAYARMNQPEKEFALYQSLLKELAARAEGVPLGLPGPAYSRAVSGEPLAEMRSDTQPGAAALPPGARSAQYAQVLDRYLSRLVSLQRLPDALAVLRGELDRNPQDPGLYERLAEFLEQNSLTAQQEEVYQRAIQQFQDEDWYGKLARFYLRHKRNSDYSALEQKVAGIFAGTGLEAYLRAAPAPNRRLGLEVNLYAQQRFPHDLRFVENLLRYYGSTHQQAEIEKLLWAHWGESPLLRDQLFELLSRTGRLDGVLQSLRQQSPEIERADWAALGASNPAAERLWMEASLWQSRFEQSVGAAEALATAYPADAAIGNQASSLYRSLAYFHPEDTDKAAAIEKRLLDAMPGRLDTMARIGDIYADRGRFAEAAPYWTRMAEVHAGEAEGYLESATVFWDYFDFGAASGQLHRARERLGQPALFAYQIGAVEESRGNVAGAAKEYAAGVLGGESSGQSRERLLALARGGEHNGKQNGERNGERNGAMRSVVEDATAGLLQGDAPSAAAVDLRAAILAAEQRKDDLARELSSLVARTSSFDVLDVVTASARMQGLQPVEEAALRRQIALVADPVRKLQLRYELVALLEPRDPAAAAAEVDAIHNEYAKILGVVRATVDFDWDHDRRPQAIAVLQEAAHSAYPDLRNNFLLEAAGKMTTLGEFAPSRTLLAELLKQDPLDARYEAAMADNLARAGDQAGLASFYRAELDGVKASSLAAADKTRRVAELRRGMIAADTVLGNTPEAVEQYIALINAYPDDAALTQEAALYALAHGAREQLSGFYAKTIEQSPRDPRWSIVLARLETAAEDYPAAAAAYGKALALRPERSDLYMARADLEARLQRPDDAVLDYQKLYTLSYRDPQWMEKIAETRARQGRNAEVVKALETGWIDGRPVRASNFFDVATRLEQWGFLEDARRFAEQGLDAAGADLLVDPQSQIGAATYARIMARLRQTSTAYAKLAAAQQQAGHVTLTALAQQVEKEGVAAVTDEEWRKQREAQRTQAAASGFARAVTAMGQAAGEYDTPEEKAQLAVWLRSISTSAGETELRDVYLPAVTAAGLADVESELRWKLAQRQGDQQTAAVNAWMQLQERRVLLDDAGKKLEELAAAAAVARSSELWRDAMDAYRKSGDERGELRAAERLVSAETQDGVLWQRLYQLLLKQRPQELLRRAANEDGAVQYLIENGSPEQALAAVSARAVDRAAGRAAVWNKAYTALTGFYLRQNTPPIAEAFAGALGDAPIGERVARAAGRSQQLAGEAWFYYGQRYGEYLDEEKDAQAEGYLASELEHTPEDPQSYVTLATYSNMVGRSQDAIADYHRALDLRSGQPAVLNDLARIEWKLGRHEEALATWREAVRMLTEEIDARPVPENFWEDFRPVLEAVHGAGEYAAVSQQVDDLLHTYLVRNGSYRLEPLLEAGYHANANSVDWLLRITASAGNQEEVLASLWSVRWIEKGQRSRILMRLVELNHDKAAATQAGGASFYELKLASAFADEKNFAGLRALLTQLPATEQASAEWLSLRLRLADAEGTLAQLVQQWKKQSDAPAEADLRNAVALLSVPGRRLVMTYVYERAIDNRELTAPNFLGLATIRLDEGNTAAAVTLLKRMTLVSTDRYADLDSAAALLEQHGKPSEALDFLRPLADGSPWNAKYRVRLATAILSANGSGSTAAVAMLATVASDPLATYQVRLAAAAALHGLSATPQGSVELRLIAQTTCPSPQAASQPYFTAARVAAARCAASDSVREPLLRVALAAAPDDNRVRLAFVWAAFGDGKDSLALLGAAPFLQDSAMNQPAEFAEPDSNPGEGEAPASAATTVESSPANAAMTPEEQARLYQLAIRAEEQRHEVAEALRLAVQAQNHTTGPQKKPFRAARLRLQAELERQQESARRAPNIHAELAQDHIVKPRLLSDQSAPARPSKEDAP